MIGELKSKMTFIKHWTVIAVTLTLVFTALVVTAKSPLHGEDALVCRLQPGSCNANSRSLEVEEEVEAAESTTTRSHETTDSTCALYLAESLMQPGTFNLFVGTNIRGQDYISTSEAIFAMIDVNRNDHAPWHAFYWAWDSLGGRHVNDAYYLSLLLVPGIASLSLCGTQSNIQFPSIDPNMHRSQHAAAAGSYAVMHESHAQVHPRGLVAGEEVVLHCEQSRFEEDTTEPPSQALEDRPIASMDYLHTRGICLDSLDVGPSSQQHGWGAFARHAVQQGDAVATSPVLYMARSDLDIVEQQIVSPEAHLTRPHGIQYNATHVLGHQLIMNYCYSHPDSDVMLFPLAPGVNYINHAPSSSSSTRDNGNPIANVRLQWSRQQDASAWHQMTPYVLWAQPNDKTLLVEYVATRDIAAGEELFLDYGDDWVQAWNAHTQRWNEQTRDANEISFMTAADYTVQHEHTTKDSPIPLVRTTQEQVDSPYPDNLQTVCRHYDTELSYGCWYPCDIIERVATSTTEASMKSKYTYSATLYNIENIQDSTVCMAWPESGQPVTELHANDVTVMDRPNTQNLQHAFRHPIGVPSDLYPRMWMREDMRPMGDFSPEPLGPGELAPIRWGDTHQVVTRHAYRLGLPEQIRTVLLDYCNKMGITDILRTVTIEGNTLEANADASVTVHGFNWYLQRPAANWASNLHWLSPADRLAHEDYLQALQLAGFDDVLKSIGEYFDMDGLVAFQVTFIGISRSSQGLFHTDVRRTEAKAYNIIIPLILANQTGPELGLQADLRLDNEGEYAKGRYRYEYNVASMMGDDAVHASSAVDYRSNKEFRMAATIYVADVNTRNVASIMSDYTQAYPPRDRDMLLSWAGRHWKKDDPSRHLPEPIPSHVLLQQCDATME
jgi:hypothetical protein